MNRFINIKPSLIERLISKINNYYKRNYLFRKYHCYKYIFKYRGILELLQTIYFDYKIKQNLNKITKHYKAIL